jgi:hypothetical protein
MMIMPFPKSIRIGKRKFETLQDFADHYGIHRTTIASRMKAGQTPEQAVGLAPHTKTIRYQSQHFHSVSALAAHVDVDAEALGRRLSRFPQRGVASAVDAVKASAARRGQPVRYEGVPFDCLGSLAAHLGEPLPKLRVRLRQRNAPLAALTAEHVKPRLKAVTVAGRDYRTMTKAARAHGIKPALFIERINHGWTPDQAAEVEDRPRVPNPWLFANVEGEIHKPGALAGDYKLYQIRNLTNGKLYVGMTVSSLAERFTAHLKDAKRKRKQPSNGLSRALREEGAGNFEISLLRNDARSYTMLQEQEVETIRAWNTTDPNVGYNIAAGGSSGCGNQRRVTVAGITYASLGAVADHFAGDPNTIRSRLNKGWTPEQAVGLDHPPRMPTRPVTIGEITYPSIRAAAAAFGEDQRNVAARLQRGATPEQAVGLDPLAIRTRHSVDAFGQRWNSLGECATAHGVNRKSVKLRMEQYGEDIETALRHAQEHTLKVTAFGREWESETACIEAHGLNRLSVWRRVRELGEDLETAIQNLKVAVEWRVPAFGKEWPSYNQLADAYGVKLGSLRKRMRVNGEDPETAVRHLQRYAGIKVTPLPRKRRT